MTVTVYATRKKGIGGWLIVPAIGLALAPPGFVFIVSSMAFWLFSQDLRNLWSSQPDVVVEVVIGLLCYIGIGFLACKTSYAFFKKQLTAPKLVERLGIVEFAFETIRSILYAIASDGGTGDWIGVFLRICVGAIALGVWITYFETSRRVQATFVN